eukprot:CAMPEP_0202455656 /NCGR_PEP_ID=MMETSP1360-20130828/13127_1 /ASSEMBLY_ACC=CAM_ASM_000848 /TAXON_ID=515479 /ORGANISM="Licmophora paradoxa, Strain CCMP2313" /LENGTH=512 /DNA_ID=CAMNT_0049075285 /DNA_START=29 /DNA_END=1567 /DNA_ORIENTATION=+
MVSTKSTKSRRGDRNGPTEQIEEDTFGPGELEYEEEVSYEEGDTITNNNGRNINTTEINNNKKSDLKLSLLFIAFVIAGTGNSVFMKLQTGPLYNYPNFANLFGCMSYIPITFAYIIPMSIMGKLPREQLEMSKLPFAIMGALDCLASMMISFASVYVPGPLVVLLPQAAIPISMILTRFLGRERYSYTQYIGAIVVLMGILVALEPQITKRHQGDYLCEAIDLSAHCTICQTETLQEQCLAHKLDTHQVNSSTFFLISNQTISDDDEGQSICEWIPSESTSTGEEWLVLIWAGVIILSTIPLTISTIYKEISLGEQELDPVYLNGWIAIFQTIFSTFLAVPAGIASSPSVIPKDLPTNLWNGLLCYAGKGSIETGCHPDQFCGQAATYFNIGLAFNLAYCFLMMMLLKLGSSSLMFLALTIMVPLGNLAFALPIMPNPAKFHFSDVMGLVVIMMGLIMYRFSGSVKHPHQQETMQATGPSLSVRDLEPLREPLLMSFYLESSRNISSEASI